MVRKGAGESEPMPPGSAACAVAALPTLTEAMCACWGLNGPLNSKVARLPDLVLS